MAKKRNPDKIAVEEFLEEYKPTPIVAPFQYKPASPADFRRGEEASMAEYEREQNEARERARVAEEALAALKEADRQAQLGTEGNERADILAKLAQAQADKIAADKAIADAKAKADLDAAAAAKKAAEDQAKLQAALDAANKAIADAANKSAAEKAAAELAARNAKLALDAANAANAASGNLNVAGNVFIPGTPAAGSMGAADILAKQYAEQQAQREKDEAMQRESIISIMSDRLTRYNLTGLIPTIKRLAQEGATESTITFALQETEDYKRRFAGNEIRAKKGLQVLDAAQYLNAEDRYRQYLRDYGLKQFDTDDYVRKFIENDTSLGELSNRINIAATRIQNADPSVKAMLRDYYKLDDTQLLAYVLDPESQIAEVQRRATAGEIGAAAGMQGIRTGVDVAEQLARQGIDKQAAQRGYSTIADSLPTSQKLSDLYNTMPGYGLADAEQDVFNTLASAQRKRKNLIGREKAEFGGTSGLSRTALDKATGGTY
jgi:hypothetical protein